MTLIASVLHLNREAHKALRITDLYSLHRVVYSLYEDIRGDDPNQSNASSGILFADLGGEARARRILLLANRQPRPHLDGGYGEVQSKAVPESLFDHTCFQFSVICNPTRRNNQSRKLIPIKDRADIAQWFSDRAQAQWGFTTNSETLDVGSIDVKQFKVKQQRPVTLMQVPVSGVLNVTDPPRFKKHFSEGIGRGRTFGCGLLQITPLSP